MSFITKRERVFHDYDLLDLPARNECKLKEYKSCTDTRAWSHFSSDKAENLVEIIKRNNDRCAPKYVPTKVIVETLMVTKNAEISRLKRKIGQFEEMLAAYDQLDLNSCQRMEIEKAHQAIRAANKDLDEMFLDLDVSGFTEAIDSEAFETGKSRPDSQMMRGDDWSFDNETRVETKGVQKSIPTDTKAIGVTDPRINEMQEVIICKDAKLCAMRNTIAVMENDVCEPYCVYAHIYTALEKIYSILRQHERYKEYLDLLVNGKDTRNLDIKGKIYFKMKVLEKLCLALIAPCSKEFENQQLDPSCYRAEVVTRIETTYALTAPEAISPKDDKRTQLVADIMENVEMKEILSKSSAEEPQVDDDFVPACDIETCIESENLKRLKQLQANYDELMDCYENVKHERICLQLRCSRYNELEYELEKLRLQAKEYNALWNEKEFYRKRSEDTDELREKYFVLYEESANLDTKLKAEIDKNNMKSNTIAELRSENLALEKKLNEASILFEKGYNTLQCKLKETECKCICYDEQVRSLSAQIDRLLEQEHDQQEGKMEQHHIYLINEVETLKEELKNMQESLSTSEEEKKILQNKFQEDLALITDLQMKFEEMKCAYEEANRHNVVMKRHNDQMKDDLDEIAKENHYLNICHSEDQNAIKNLTEVVNNKSSQIDELTQMNEILKQERLNHLPLMQENEHLRENLLKVNNEIEMVKEGINKYEALLHEESQKANRLEAQFKNELERLEKLYQDLLDEKNILEDAFNDQSKKMETLIKKENLYSEQQQENEKKLSEMQQELENKNSQLKTLLDAVKESEKVPILKLQFQKTIDDALSDKVRLQNECDSKIQEIKKLNGLLKDKTKENLDLLDQIALLKLRQTKSADSLENMMKDNQEKSDNIKRERQRVQEISEQNDKLVDALTKAKQALDDISSQKSMLNKELEACKQALKKTEENNSLLYEQSTALMLNNEKLENALIIARNEIKLSAESSKGPYEALYKEINQMKEEKIKCHNKIRELYDTIEQTENYMTNLNEELLARDDKLAIQQNHINELEAELRQLHDNLEMAMTAGEEIRDNSEQKVLVSLKKMEAHHSKATHNMKMEVAMLENNKMMMQEELSETKLQNERALNDKKDQLSQVLKLLKEREIIATEIKELELMTSDNSILSPENCDVEHLLSSIDNIRKYLDKTLNDSSNLEKRLSKVQTSSQMLLNKADEEKKILEKENHKILSEKEEAIKGRQQLEKRLTDMKVNLEKQIADDKMIIKDLNSELLSQKLIIDKIKSSELNISKEMDNLKDSYKRRIEEYERKIKELSEEKSKNIGILQKVNDTLKDKADEISKLQSQLAKLKSKEVKNTVTQTNFKVKNSKTETDLKKESAKSKDFNSKETQVTLKENNQNIAIQTDPKLETIDSKINEVQVKSEKIDNIKYSHMLNANTHGKDKRRNNTLPSNNSYTENDVQILTAQVEPTTNALDIVKKGYINFKMKKLSPGPIEHHTIGDLVVRQDNMENRMNTQKKGNDLIFSLNNTDEQNFDNNKTDSNKTSTKGEDKFANGKKNIKISIKQELTDNNLLNIEESSDSTDNKDMFYIIKDSDSNSETNIDTKYDKNKVDLAVRNVIVEGKALQEPQVGKSYKVIDNNMIKNDNNASKKTQQSLTHNKKANATSTITAPNENQRSDSMSLTSMVEARSLDSNISEGKSRTTFLSISDSNIIPGQAKFKKNLPQADGNTSLKVQQTDGSTSLKVLYPGNNKNTQLLENKKKRDGDPIILTNEQIVTKKDLNKLRDKTAKNEINIPNSKFVHKDISSIHPNNRPDRYRRTLGNTKNSNPVKENPGLKFIVETLQHELSPKLRTELSKKSKSDYNVYSEDELNDFQKPLRTNVSEYSSNSSSKKYPDNYHLIDKGVMAKDYVVDQEEKIKQLTQTLEDVRRDSKRKIEEIKLQYDNNIRNIINEHDEGVRNLQGLHEEMLHDILNDHENEVENLRSMSIEALRRLEKLEKEKQVVTNGFSTNIIDQEPTRITCPKQAHKILTQTNIQSFDVTPKNRRLGPCTCSMNNNTMETYRKMFDQVDGDKRKIAEEAYMKFVCNKLLNENYENLDAQELSFLHFKVCRIWKHKIEQEEALQQRIHSLESEVMAKQRHAYEYIAELDRQVAEENRRLQEVREAVCLQSDYTSGIGSTISNKFSLTPHTDDKKLSCHCMDEARLDARDKDMCSGEMLKCPRAGRRPKRIKLSNDKPILAALIKETRLEKRNLTDETPTRLRRAREKTPPRSRKK